MVRVGAEIDPSFNSSLDTAGQKVGDFGDKTTVAGEAWAQASGRIKDAVPDLKEIGESTDKAAESLAHMVEGLIQVAEALVVTEALKEFGEEALSTYANIQKASISLTALTGSSEEAEVAIEKLKGIAISDALSFPQLVQAYQRMTAFGISSEQIPSVLQAAANAAAATDKAFDSVANSIERMALSGAASGKALANLGISVNDLGAALNVTGTEASAAFKALDVGERITVLSTALSKYADVAKATAGSIAGQWQNLKTQTEFVFESVGQSLAPVAAQFMQLLSQNVLPFIQSLVDGFGKLPAPIKDVVVVLGFLAAAIPTVSIALSGLTKVLGAFEVINVTGWASSLLEMIPNIVFAVQNDLVGALSAGETAILRLGQASIVAGAAFAGWELGTWLYKNVPLLKDFGDAIGDLILKLPGLETLINKLNGVGTAEENLLKATTALNDKLAIFGSEVVRQTGESLDSFAARVRAAANEQANATVRTAALTEEQKKLAHEIDGIQQLWSNQVVALINAKSHLEAVTLAYEGHTASLGQLRAAQDAVDKAQKDLNPEFITAKDYQELLKKSADDLTQAEAALTSAYSKIAPQLLDVQTAEANVAKSRGDLKAQTALLIGAEMQLVAARNSGNASGLQAAMDAEVDAKKRVEQATHQLAAADKELSDAKKAEKEVDDALASAENDFANTIAALHVPALKSYSEQLKDVEAKKKALVDANDAEIDAFMALNDLTLAGQKDTAAYKDALDNLAQAKTAVKDATNNLKTSEKDLTDIQNALKSASSELAAGEQALAALYKDHLAGTQSLKAAITDLTAARGAEKTAADNLRVAEETLNAVKKASEQTDVDSVKSADDLKKATDDARVARENLKIATANAASAEGTIQQQFGLSKTAADVLAGSTVSLTEIFRDMGLKSAASLQALADVSKKEYDLIASSGTASANQLRDAQIKALQDQKAAYIANGTDLTAAQQNTLDSLLAQQTLYTEKVRLQTQNWAQAWADSIVQINKAITTDLGKALTDLATGVGKVGDDFKKLGIDIVDIVINHILAEAIKPLLSSLDDLLSKIGGGLTDAITGCWGAMSKGIKDSITGIGELDKSIATTAGDLSKLGDASGPPGGGTGGTGGTGGAGAVGNSLSGWISAIAGVATAIEGIVGIFQNMHQETSLNAIEHNTRYTMMYVGERADGGILGQAFKTNEYLSFGPIVKALEMVRDKFIYYSDVSLKKFGEIADQTYWSMKKLDSIDSKIGKAPISSTDTAQLGALDWMKVALQNINNNLVAMIAQNEWIKTALQNINNGIVASAGWLQGISNMFSSGAAKVGAQTTQPPIPPDAFATLASFTASQFSTLYTWLGAALKPLLTIQGGQALTVAPTLPTAPTFGSTATVPAGTATPAAFDTTALQTAVKAVGDIATAGFASVVTAIKAISPVDVSKLGTSVNVTASSGDFVGALKGLGDALGLKLDRLTAVIMLDPGTAILSAQLARITEAIGRVGDLVAGSVSQIVGALKVSDQVMIASLGQVIKGEAELFGQGLAEIAGMGAIRTAIGQLTDVASTNFQALIAAVKVTVSVPTPTLALANGGTAAGISAAAATAPSRESSLNISFPGATFHGGPTAQTAALWGDILIRELRRRGRTPQ